MQVNTLVTHKKLKSLGIGCVSKVLSKKVVVNFGQEDVLTCSPSALQEVDTSECRTIPFQEFKKLITSCEDKEDFIIGNELKQSMGIGLVTIRVVTHDDLRKYRRVVD